MQKQQLRRIFVIGLLVMLGAAALLGIMALLTGGDVSTEILASTLLAGAFCVLALCDLTVIDMKRARLFGLAAILVAGVALLAGLNLIWGVADWFDDSNNMQWKLFYIFLVLGVGMAHMSLLLPTTAHRKGPVAFSGLLTVICIAIVAVQLVFPVFINWEVDESYWRLLGVFAILDVLGTVTTAVLARLQKSTTPADKAKKAK